MAHRLEIKINQLVENILADYSLGRDIDLTDNSMYPSRDDIIKIIFQLRNIVFPSYFKNERAYTARGILVVLQEDVMFDISRQVSLALKCLPEYEDFGEQEMLIFRNDTRERICHHASAEYPRECCGILLGKHQCGQRIVCDVLSARNAAKDTQMLDAFMIEPLDVLAAEKTARDRRLEIVGFYHSHPDCDAYPSANDTMHMVAGLSYPVVSVISGEWIHVRSFVRPSQTSSETTEEFVV